MSATNRSLPAVIPEGERNDTLFRFAAAMRYQDATEGTILAALRIENERRCQPPLPTASLRAWRTAPREAVVVQADDESHALRRVKQWLKAIRFHHIAALSFNVRAYAAVHVLQEESR